jgi:hypothetical protein
VTPVAGRQRDQWGALPSRRADSVGRLSSAFASAMPTLVSAGSASTALILAMYVSQDSLAVRLTGVAHNWKETNQVDSAGEPARAA